MPISDVSWTDDRKWIAQICPMDPVFLQCMFEYNPHLLEKAAVIILQRQDLVRKGYFTAGNGTGIRMQDGGGREVRITIAGEGFCPVRRTGAVPYDARRPVSAWYDIRIAENDAFGQGWPVYCFASGEKTRLIINGGYRGESALSCLLHDLRCPAPENMLLPELILTVRYLKESEAGIRRVVRAMENAQPGAAIG
ncbi:MAG: hypothetical protein IJ088_00730 [Clostridia bacterium]|nr:hypothetical protein [Clostridia bacterium]